VAQASSIPEANAMTLATVSEGKPSARIVLLKGLEEEGFIFYTNYQSRKGKELAQNPHAALVFLWLEIERQVRIEGICEKVDPRISDAYFNSRPDGSRIGAIASPQSKIVSDRAELDGYKEAAIKSADYNRPEHWGGYIVKPTIIEFWQGRQDRMHDRFCYSKIENNWQIERLAP
jgi:pyridoxamine 5'-phosphate oxidase